jgi:hypothetical protein
VYLTPRFHNSRLNCLSLPTLATCLTWYRNYIHHRILIMKLGAAMGFILVRIIPFSRLRVHIFGHCQYVLFCIPVRIGTPFTFANHNMHTLAFANNTHVHTGLHAEYWQRSPMLRLTVRACPATGNKAADSNFIFAYLILLLFDGFFWTTCSQ